MPIYDYQCDDCGHEFEAIADINAKHRICVRCQGPAHRTISVGCVYLGNQDASWLKSVRVVVDKNGGSHCQEFLRDPSRKNYKAWMRGEGIQPLERGEKGGSRVTSAEKRLRHQQIVNTCKSRQQERNGIIINAKEGVRHGNRDDK